MDILTSFVALATGLITLAKALLEYCPALWRRLRSIRVVRVDPSRGGRDFESMTPLNLSSLRPRRRQNSFDQVVGESPPMSSPKAVWPPPYEKAVVDTDFMVRGPHPTTDTGRPFVDRGSNPCIQPSGPPSNPQFD